MLTLTGTLASIVSVWIGFSVIAALLLALSFASAYRGLAMPFQSRIGGFVMLAGLGSVQLLHAQFLDGQAAMLLTRLYVAVLALQSLGFYWLFLGLLRYDCQAWSWEWYTAAMLLLALLPAPVALTCIFAAGGAGSVHLAFLVHKLRAQRRWFAVELKVLMLFAIMALLIATAGFAAPVFGWRFFAASYACLIGFSFALVLYLLLRFPDITSKAQEAVAATYAVSTLSRVDCEKVTSELKRLFAEEKIYQDENLSLSKLADMLALSGHQLSELINTQFEMGFSKLVRGYRVDAAKHMLINEPRASVLSVGLSVGFTSQSNFYAAFKELTGLVPGNYRKQSLAASESKLA